MRITRYDQAAEEAVNHASIITPEDCNHATPCCQLLDSHAASWPAGRPGANADSRHRPAGNFVKAHTGFVFTEGPAADAQGNVYFVDIRNNRIHKVDTDGKLSTFLEDSKACN